MEEKNAQRPPSVPLAFRLGWTLAEFMGRSRRSRSGGQRRAGRSQTHQSPKELKGFTSDEAPRLTYSNRYFSREGAWWQAALRMVSLAEQLDLFDPEGEQAQEVRALPEQIYALTFDGESGGERRSPRDFYDLLEPWSREVGIKLAARSDQAALAFKVGGQIADTYWYVRGKEHYGEPRDRDKQDSWHQLLNHKRLMTIIEDIKRFEEELPPLVGPCLRFSLYRWTIAHDLEYRNEELILARGKRHKDRRLEREKGGILKSLKPEDEGKVVRQLERQTAVWQDLILGARAPDRYLNRRDQRVIFWRSLRRYSLVVVGAIAGLSTIGYLAIILLGGYLPIWLTGLFDLLTPTEPRPKTLDKSLSIVTESLPLIASALVFVASLLRDGWIETKGLWQRIRADVQERQIKKSTWVPVGLSTRWYRWRYWRKTD